MAEQTGSSSILFGKGGTEGATTGSKAADVEDVATQLQSVTIDGGGAEGKDAAAAGSSEEGAGSSLVTGGSSIRAAAGGRGALRGGEGGQEEEEEEENEVLALLSAEQRAVVDTLSQLQQKHDRLEHQYETELVALKMKYEALYAPLYVQRKERLLQKDPTNPAADEKGTPAIPRFWVECLKRNATIADMIEEHDEPILEYLQNISCEYFTPEEQRQMEQEHQQQQGAAGGATRGNNTPASTSSPKRTTTEFPESFRLIFDFAPNPFFTPLRLVKAYHLSTVGGEGGRGAAGKGKEEGGGKADASGLAEEGKDEEAPPPPVGAELTSTRSTQIKWETGKDVTKKIVSRKQRNKKTKQTRLVQEVVDSESFFNFFTDHDIPTDEKLETMTDKQVGELQMVVEADYDIGVILRDRIIPQAVKWYLGEAEDEEQMDDDLEDEEEDDDDDSEGVSESEDDDEDERRPARGRGKHWGGRGRGGDNW